MSFLPLKIYIGSVFLRCINIVDKRIDLAHLWAYLWTNWYDKKNWKLFARSSYPRATPIARTTMIIESHWRVLKYNYKHNYSKPRLDYLNYIITERLVSDTINT